MNFMPATVEGDSVKLPFGDGPAAGRARATRSGTREARTS